MSARLMHCPFLNRADARCAGHFCLDRLDVAFEHCFGQYHACATYQELLQERCQRRTGEVAASSSDNEAYHAQRRNGFALPVLTPAAERGAQAVEPAVLLSHGYRHPLA